MKITKDLLKKIISEEIVQANEMYSAYLDPDEDKDEKNISTRITVGDIIYEVDYTINRGEVTIDYVAENGQEIRDEKLDNAIIQIIKKASKIKNTSNYDY